MACQPAVAAKLVRCEAVLQGPGGEVPVPAWGRSPEQAAERAEDLAWVLALADSWSALAAGSVALPEEWAARREALVAQHVAEGSWRVVGYSVVPGACSSETLPPTRGEAWSASWQEEEDRATLRNAPDVAIEAARRRRCFGAWQHRMVKAAQLGESAEEERYGVIHGSARASTDALLACISREEPVLTLAGAPIPEIEEFGTVQCQRPRRVGGVWTGAVAWRAQAEDAREAAMVEDLFVQIRRAESALVAVAAGPDPETRAAHLARLAMGQLSGLVVANDLSEQALVSCVSGPPNTTRLDWTPAERVSCPGWPAGEGVPLTALATQVEASQDARCEAGYRASLLEDWRAAGRCEASCRSEVVLAGWRSEAIWRSGEPRRGTAKEAEQALGQAIGTQDWHLLGVVTGGLIFEPAYVAQFRSNPTAFWASIEQAKNSGTWSERAEWHHLGGAWVLGFK